MNKRQKKKMWKLDPVKYMTSVEYWEFKIIHSFRKTYCQILTPQDKILIRAHANQAALQARAAMARYLFEVKLVPLKIDVSV